MAAKNGKSNKTNSKDSDNQLAELKQRIAELEAQNEELAKKSAPKEVKSQGSFFRSLGITFFVTLSIVTFMLFNVSSWVKATILDTDTFVATTQPLLEQPAVQQTLQTEISNAIFENIDVEAELAKALPEDVAFLAAPLSDQVESFTTDKIGELLSSEQVNMVWTTTLETVHSTLIGYLQNEDTDGVISVNDVYAYASEELQDTSIAFLLNKQLPESVGQITLAELPWVDDAKQYINTLEKLPVAFLLTSIISFTLALLLAVNKKKVFIIVLVLNVMMMLATLGSIEVGKIATENNVEAAYSAAAVEVYQVLSNPLVSRTQGYLALLSVILLVVFVTSKVSIVVRARSLGSKYSTMAVEKVTPDFEVPSWLNWVITDKKTLLWATFVASFILFGVRIPPDYSQVISGLIISSIIVFIIYIFSVVLESATTPKKSRK